MASSQEKTLEALQVAVRMEIDGQTFYTSASQNSSHPLGKKLLAALAAEEDIHRRRFEEIYDSLKARHGWQVSPRHYDGGKSLKNIFNEASPPSGASASREMDAVETALGMENKSIDFYNLQTQQSDDPNAREYYENIAAEERVHAELLADYREYLKNPAGFFVNKEHPSLDGG